MPLRRYSLLGLALAALSAAACEDSPKSSPTTSAPTATAVDVRAICERACDRTAECALEIARRATRGYEDKPDVKRAVADEEKAAQDNRDACRKDCREQPIADSDRAQLADAAKCLELGDCTGFIACFEKLGTASK
jgi:hypothetical protein